MVPLLLACDRWVHYDKGQHGGAKLLTSQPTRREGMKEGPSISSKDISSDFRTSQEAPLLRFHALPRVPRTGKTRFLIPGPWGTYFSTIAEGEGNNPRYPPGSGW